MMERLMVLKRKILKNTGKCALQYYADKILLYIILFVQCCVTSAIVNVPLNELENQGFIIYVFLDFPNFHKFSILIVHCQSFQSPSFIFCPITPNSLSPLWLRSELFGGLPVGCNELNTSAVCFLNVHTT